jgi:uncharacterized OB-fold protein
VAQVTTRTRVPAVEGWFTLDDGDPALLGTRCTTCGTVFFPREERSCRNPECDGTELAEVRLSTRGRVWSYTNACYQPPAPYVPRSDPFEPFTLAAVELADEQLVVLGQVVDGVGVDDLSVGTEVELVLDTLFEDDEKETVVWKWRPV